jgi:D-alanine-D-alanine ligase
VRRKHKEEASTALAETRILVLSSRDPHEAGGEEPPLSELRSLAHRSAIREDHVAHIIDGLMAAMASLPGVRVAHRSVRRPSDILVATADHRCDLVFNACESLADDSRLEVTAAWLLERLGVPFSGSPYFALRHCLFKVETSQLLQRSGVRVPRTYRVRSPDDLPLVQFPVIVKPEREDGSLGIDRNSVVFNPSQLAEQVAYVVRTFDQAAVVQQYIEGRELSVSLLGWPVPRVLPLGEIAFSGLGEEHPRILTYASKWIDDSVENRGTESIAAVLRPTLLRRVAAMGRRAFDVLGLRDYGRVDFRLDASGVPYVIDVNPNCDLSSDGGFARAARRAGFTYTALLWEVLRGAIRRRADQSTLLASRGRPHRLAGT